MTRKERAGLAKALKDVRPTNPVMEEPWLQSVRAIGRMMEELDGSFDAGMFLKACGVKS